jgi:hypothetical protein
MIRIADFPYRSYPALRRNVNTNKTYKSVVANHRYVQTGNYPGIPTLT